jgi:outer membrane protein assembly factor BamB
MIQISTNILRKTICTIIIAIILTPTILSVTNTTTANIQDKTIITSGQCKKGYRYNVQGWVYIHIEGESYERGYQYGYLASGEIVDMINRWGNWGHKEDITKLFILKNRPEKYDELSEQWWNIIRRRGMRFFWDQIPEEYQQEIKGIADGVSDRGGTVHGRLVDHIDILSLNVVEETRQTIQKLGKIGRPFKWAFNLIKGLLKGMTKDENLFGHCNGFIATGDATVDGRIVMSHSTIFPPNYILQRANIILDVQPSKGNRFVMTCFPGYIWSSEDYYQNEQGILLMETTLWPWEGPWKIKGTKPVGIRARRAIQYSNSIDEVIQSFLDGNNGLYQNDWVMGNTKTGEIASLELGLYNHAITRTKNGFLWSSNNAKNDKVRWELFSFFGLGIPGRIFFRNFRPNPRDIKFKELGEKFYGKINVSVVKKIMSTPPISDLPIDCKITDSKLVEELGLWAHMGKLDGTTFVPKQKDQEQLKGLTDIPASGWVKVFASKSKPNDIKTISMEDISEQNSELVWTYETGETRNVDFALITGSTDSIYAASSSSEIYAVDANIGELIWKHPIGKSCFTPLISDNLVFIATDKGLAAIDKDIGTVQWEQKIGRISSKPVITKNSVIAGFSNGEICGFDIDSGKVEWSCCFSESPSISEVNGNIIYICSENSCYAFDIANKKVLWEYETNGVVTASPKISDKTVYLGSWDGNIHAINSKSGELRWKFETGWGIDSTPTVDDGMVFVGSLDNRFYALDEDSGVLVWCFQCKSAVHSSPVVYGDLVFFGSDDGIFYALDKKTGNPDWSFTPGFSIKNNDVNNFVTTPILCDPVVENGVVYVSAKGNIYALDAQTIEIPNIPKTAGSHNNNNLIMMLIIVAISMLMISFVIFIKNKLF